MFARAAGAEVHLLGRGPFARVRALRSGSTASGPRTSFPTCPGTPSSTPPTPRTFPRRRSNSSSRAGGWCTSGSAGSPSLIDTRMLALAMSPPSASSAPRPASTRPSPRTRAAPSTPGRSSPPPSTSTSSRRRARRRTARGAGPGPKIHVEVLPPVGRHPLIVQIGTPPGAFWGRRAPARMERLDPRPDAGPPTTMSRQLDGIHDELDLSLLRPFVTIGGGRRQLRPTVVAATPHGFTGSHPCRHRRRRRYPCRSETRAQPHAVHGLEHLLRTRWRLRPRTRSNQSPTRWSAADWRSRLRHRLARRRLAGRPVRASAAGDLAPNPAKFPNGLSRSSTTSTARV